MKGKREARNVEIYLEDPEAYQGGLAPEIERLADALRLWPQVAALQPRSGFINELAQQLGAPENAPEGKRMVRPWFDQGGGLLRRVAAATAALLLLLLFGLWLASLSAPAGAPATTGAVPTAIPFVGEGGAGWEGSRALADPSLWLQSGVAALLDTAAALVFILLPAAALLLAVTILLRARPAGKVAAVVGGVALLLALAGFHSGDVSWRLLPVLVNGYRYEPGVESPDPRLVREQPDVLIARQLDALLGETGEPPLRADLPLAAYTIHEVRIDDWRGKRLRAELPTTLTFADDSQVEVTLSIQSGAGQTLLFPGLGTVNRAVFAWYAPESSLGHLFQTPAPGTALHAGEPPLVLAPVAEIEALGAVAPLDPAHSFVSVSSLTAGGDLLADVDLREGERNVGNALLFHPAGDEYHLLARTRLSTRADVSPDGRRLAYVRGPAGGTLELVVRELDGGERVISRVDWMSHHWVGNERIAFARDDRVYLHDSRSGTERAVAPLVFSGLVDAGHFRVSPDARHIAYVDFEGRLWVEPIDGGARRHVGWDVYDLGWGHGLAWSPDGRQLLYTALDNVTLPSQAELWLWDARSGQSRLLARSGRDASAARYGAPCWLDGQTVLFTADLAMADDVRLLLARADGGGLWDVTPAGTTVPYATTHCGRGLVAANPTRTKVALFKATEPASAARVVLARSDLPLAGTPAYVAEGDFWLAHGPAGALFAFAPVSPGYRPGIAVEPCRYVWNEAVGRFVDPCSGDEWELDGQLNLSHSSELWSRRDLDRYELTVSGDSVTVFLDRSIPGRARTR